MSEHEPCWHTGSDMDCASYSTDTTITITHFIYCHCGQTKTEKHIWKRDEELWRKPDKKKHGEYDWSTIRSEYRSIFSS